MSLRRWPLLAPVFVISTLALQAGPRTQSEPRIAGTYTDMHYIEESGDVLGTEVKIVFTGFNYQGALQIAEGPPGQLSLVDIAVKGSSIQFSIPDGSGYPGSFNGVVTDGWLRGTFHFKSGGEAKVALHRGKSYWDSAEDVCPKKKSSSK